MARTAVKMSVRERDRGYRRMAQLTAAASRHMNTVDVGVIGDKAAEPHEEGGDLTVAQVAGFHEFGTVGVPERSFIRGWVDENAKTVRRVRRKEAEKIVRRKQSIKQGLDRMGQVFVGGMQARIAKGIDPPLSPVTIERKGSSAPLIDTGQLRSSITHRVNK